MPHVHVSVCVSDDHLSGVKTALQHYATKSRPQSEYGPRLYGTRKELTKESTAEYMARQCGTYLYSVCMQKDLPCPVGYCNNARMRSKHELVCKPQTVVPP